MRNINTQATSIPPTLDGATFGPPTRDMLLAAGWRDEPPVPPIPEGYERTGLRLVEGDGQTGVWEYTDTLIKDREDAARAAKLATFPAQSVAMFRLLMRRNFGDGAETNREITAEVVLAYFADLTVRGVITAQQASDGVFLQQLFVELSAWNGTGETWTLFEQYGELLP